MTEVQEEPRYDEAKGSENLFAITRFLYIELFSICCIVTGVKKKPVRYREARFIEVPSYVYTGPPVLPHGSKDHILLIQNLDLGSFTLRQKLKRLHTFSNIMTCANA